MRVHRTTVKGKPAYQYGNTGAKYPYKPGDKAGREAAKNGRSTKPLASNTERGIPPICDRLRGGVWT